jgi:hypothetical protein
MHAAGTQGHARAADPLEVSGFYDRRCLPQLFLCIIMQENTNRDRRQEPLDELARRLCGLAPQLT